MIGMIGMIGIYRATNILLSITSSIWLLVSCQEEAARPNTADFTSVDGNGSGSANGSGDCTNGGTTSCYGNAEPSNSNNPDQPPADSDKVVYDYDSFLNNQRAKDCKEKSLVVNRDSQAKESEYCYQAVLDMSWCTSVTSIKDKFQSLANAGAAALDKMTNELKVGTPGEFEIDQCGIEKINGKDSPLVTFYKKSSDKFHLQLERMAPKWD